MITSRTLETLIMSLSKDFSRLVLAASFKWKAAGRMKAMGVQVKAPERLMYCVREFFMPRAMMMETATIKVLERFLSHFQRMVRGWSLKR